MGYAGIKNSLAIEFDTNYNFDKNDPNTINNRHLSVIVNDNNEANELDSIGWNDNPVNFNR